MTFLLSLPLFFLGFVTAITVAGAHGPPSPLWRKCVIADSNAIALVGLLLLQRRRRQRPEKGGVRGLVYGHVAGLSIGLALP